MARKSARLLGKEIGLNAIQFNKELERIGYIEKDGLIDANGTPTWRLTEDGHCYGEPSKHPYSSGHIWDDEVVRKIGNPDEYDRIIQHNRMVCSKEIDGEFMDVRDALNNPATPYDDNLDDYSNGENPYDTGDCDDYWSESSSMSGDSQNLWEENNGDFVKFLIVIVSMIVGYFAGKWAIKKCKSLSHKKRLEAEILVARKIAENYIKTDNPIIDRQKVLALILNEFASYSDEDRMFIIKNVDSFRGFQFTKRKILSGTEDC